MIQVEEPKEKVSDHMEMLPIDPTNDQRLTEFASHDTREMEHRIHVADSAEKYCAQNSVSERAGLLGHTAATLRANGKKYARLNMRGMSKPIGNVKAGIEKRAVGCDIEAAAELSIKARFQSTGSSCIAWKSDSVSAHANRGEFCPEAACKSYRGSINTACASERKISQ